MSFSETIHRRTGAGNQKMTTLDSSDVLNVYKTTDYNRFVLMPENRQIYPVHVANLRRSIQEDGYLKERPIEVIRSGDKMVIVDGQHRFTACRELELPIFYILKSEADASLAVRVVNNNAKIWRPEDYLRHFIAMKNTSYIRLAKFMEDFDVGISAALGLLTLGGKNLSNNKDTRHNFKTGHLNFSEQTLDEASIMMVPINEIRNLHERMGPLRKDPAFIKALVILTTSKIYDHERMMKNLSVNIGMVAVCTSINKYLAMLEGIYNYKRGEGKRLHLSRKGLTLIQNVDVE